MTSQDNGPKSPIAKELTWRFETVHAMSGTQFELYVAALLRALGHNTMVLGGSGDQGVDLIVDYFGERVAVQCKNYAKPVGNKPVQEVFAGAKHHRCQQAWVVAPAGFTNGASELARSVGVQLFAAGSIRAWLGEVDKVASPQPRSESFPPTYPTSELRKQDSESYDTLLDDYEMELTRLERVREELSMNPYMGEDRSLKASTVQILVDTQARIFDIRKQLDAFEKLGTGSLEQKQRHAQLEARHEQADQEARERHGVGLMSRLRTSWSGVAWAVGCSLPIGLFVAAVIVFSAGFFNVMIFSGDFDDGMLYGLAVVGAGVGCYLYALGKRYNRS